ncbi:MAG: hypothetical protein ACO3ZY_10730, partial [Phycisphaerales bacterium]
MKPRCTASASPPADRRQRLAALVDAIAAGESGATRARTASREQAREAMARRLESPDSFEEWPERGADTQGSTRDAAAAPSEKPLPESPRESVFGSSTIASTTLDSCTSPALRLSTGWPAIDRALGGGLPLGALHEWMVDSERDEGNAGMHASGEKLSERLVERSSHELDVRTDANAAELGAIGGLGMSEGDLRHARSRFTAPRWRPPRRAIAGPPLGAVIHLLWRLLDRGLGIASDLPAGARVLWIGRHVFPHPRALLRGGSQPWSPHEFEALLPSPRRSRVQPRVQLEQPFDRRLLEASWCVDPGVADASLEARAWAIEQAVRCRGVAAVVADGRGFRMPITRRLHLAAKSAEAAGEPTLLLLLREPDEANTISAASTRWRVSPRRIAEATGPIDPSVEKAAAIRDASVAVDVASRGASVEASASSGGAPSASDGAACVGSTASDAAMHATPGAVGGVTQFGSSAANEAARVGSVEAHAVVPDTPDTPDTPGASDASGTACAAPHDLLGATDEAGFGWSVSLIRRRGMGMAAARAVLETSACGESEAFEPQRGDEMPTGWIEAAPRRSRRGVSDGSPRASAAVEMEELDPRT